MRAFSPFWVVTLLLASTPALAQDPPWLTGESRPEDLSIVLVTFGPGSDVPSWFGHGALGVEDRKLHQSALYNYGMFSFDETMLARFAMGRLWFWVGDHSIQGTMRFYRSLDRYVRVQELDLEPSRAAALARALAVNVLPENRHYLYHHYRDNCVTRLRDSIDRAIDGQLRSATSNTGRMTLRGHTRRYTSVNAGMSLLLDFLMNDEIDQPIQRWDEAFLPDELETQVGELRYKRTDGTSVPLVRRQWTFATSTRPATPAMPPNYTPWTLALGFLLGALPIALVFGSTAKPRLRRIGLGMYNALLGLTFGIPGLVLFAMWTFTEHTVSYRNENLFLANPVTFLALPLGLALAFGVNKVRPWLRACWAVLAMTGLLGLLLKVLPAFDQDNARLIALLWPCSLGMATAHLWELRKFPTAAAGKIFTQISPSSPG